MKSIDLQDVELKFQAYWLMKVQNQRFARESKMTQSEMSRLTRKSLKTIQRFENGECVDARLMFLYDLYLGE